MTMALQSIWMFVPGFGYARPTASSYLDLFQVTSSGRGSPDRFLLGTVLLLQIPVSISYKAEQQS